MQDVYEALRATGFGDYESRAYCALLTEAPANGYQIARRSGIPRAKVYECLERLVARGAAVCVETADSKSRMFAPVDARAVISDIEANTITACRDARELLARFQKDPHVVEVLWRVTSKDDLIARGKKLTEEASRTLHVALWAEEFEALLPYFLRALRRGVRQAMMLYSPHDGIRQLQDLMAGAILHSRTKLQAIPVMGKQFVLVADRERCIVGSLFEGNSVEGVFTMNRGLVTNALDLVNHEIYLERILLEVGRPVLDRYGPDLDRLDAFDRPAVQPDRQTSEPTAGRTSR